MYYTRTLEGQQYCSHCRRAAGAAGPPSEADVLDLAQPEEVLLDENLRKVVGGWEVGGWEVGGWGGWAVGLGLWGGS